MAATWAQRLDEVRTRQCDSGPQPKDPNAPTRDLAAVEVDVRATSRISRHFASKIRTLSSFQDYLATFSDAYAYRRVEAFRTFILETGFDWLPTSRFVPKSRLAGRGALYSVKTHQIYLGEHLRPHVDIAVNAYVREVALAVDRYLKAKEDPASAAILRRPLP